MSTNETCFPTSNVGKRNTRPDPFEPGPRKKPCVSDPLVHHGRHFGRTVHALCNVHALLMNGIARMAASDVPEEDYSDQERREYSIFQALLKTVPSLEERLFESEEQIAIIATLLQKGISGARSDDTKSLKGAIIEWITPKGEALSPPIARNVKTDRGFNHERTGALLCPAGVDWSDKAIQAKLRSGELAVSGDQWPIFVYQGCRYDPEDPWKGLFRGAILVSTFKHIFTSPSSVEKEPKATRSGNARIHGMTRVTRASIAYVATQTRFALTSSPTFTRTDTVTDSERFYHSVLELLEDPEENIEVNELLEWWDRQVFPSFTPTARLATKGTITARIKEKRALQVSRIINT